MLKKAWIADLAAFAKCTILLHIYINACYLLLRLFLSRAEFSALFF